MRALAGANRSASGSSTSLLTNPVTQHLPRSPNAIAQVVEVARPCHRAEPHIPGARPAANVQFRQSVHGASLESGALRTGLVVGNVMPARTEALDHATFNATSAGPGDVVPIN